MKSYSIIEANIFKDKEKIFPVLLRNLNVASSKRYDWNYLKCPFGTAKCWLAKCESTGKIVGSVGLFPRRLTIHNKLINAWIVGDYAVDIKHRAFGPALQLQKKIKSTVNNDTINCIYGVPNALSKTIFDRLGYTKIGDFKLFIKIMETKYLPNVYFTHFLKSKLSLKIFNFLINLKFVHIPLDIIIKNLSKEMYRIKNNSYTPEQPDAFDERFDIFWQKISKQFPIIGERTAAFLNWRYIQSPSKNYEIFCIVDSEKNIAGYIVFYVNENLCHIVDMQFLPTDDILDSLLTEFTRYVRSQQMGAIIIRYLGDRALEKKLQEYNFHLIEKNSLNVVIRCNDLPADINILDKQNWHFFIGDSDS